MKFFAVMLSVLLGAFPPVVASEKLNPETLVTFQSHPRVLAEEAQRLQALAEVERERAALYPRLTITTDGGTQLFGNAADTQARSLGDNEYIDGILTANQRLYDFGATDARIESAQLVASARALGPDIALNQLISEAVRLAREAATRRLSIEIAQSTLGGLNAEIERAELRFQQGIEGAAEARRLSLRADDLDRQILSDQEVIRGVEASAVEQFSVSLSQLEALHLALLNAADPTGNTTLLIEQLGRQRLAELTQASAIEAERFPVVSLEVEGRLFDMDRGIGDYEVTGNLQFSIPFFDGGAREARLQAAEFTVRATDAEIQFEQRALNERLSQLSSQERQLADRLASLDEQAVKLTEQLQAGSLRQGKTENSQGEIANALLALYDNDRQRLATRAEQASIVDEKIGLLQQWPRYFASLKDTMINE